MNCKNCGAEIINGAAFCSNCGQATNNNTPAVCKSCGRELSACSVFCPYCGASTAARSCRDKSKITIARRPARHSPRCLWRAQLLSWFYGKGRHTADPRSARLHDSHQRHLGGDRGHSDPDPGYNRRRRNSAQEGRLIHSKTIHKKADAPRVPSDTGEASAFSIKISTSS